jgi:hydroxymethylglutaryl-CoA synthase
MIGITGWGCYVPRYRLTGKLISGSWGGSESGQRSIASHDEDTVTMAAQSALECMSGRDRANVDRLYLASVSLPYLEHQNAAIVAMIADLKSDMMTLDFCGSVRAGTQALRSAYEAIKSDEAKSALVSASDIRMAKPGEPIERTIGDGAASLLIGKDNPVAIFEKFHSTSKVFLDHHRRASDDFVSSGDAKYINDKGILLQLPEVVNNLFDEIDLAREEIAKVVYYAPDLRLRKALNKKLGFKKESYIENNPKELIGDTGNAQVVLSLIAALSKSKPGDRILVLGYGSGADAIILQVTENIKNFKTDLYEQLDSGREINSYAKYLKFRGIVPGEDINIWTSTPVLHREERQNYRLYGGLCKSCQAVQYPPRYKCWNCGKDEMEEKKISRFGKIFTFTVDYLPPTPDPPTTMVSVDLDGGGRFYGQMTDEDPDEIEIGQKVEMVIRKLHEGGGFNNYFWKLRPV